MIRFFFFFFLLPSGRKRDHKGRKCWSPAFSPFSNMVLKAFYLGSFNLGIEWYRVILSICKTRLKWKASENIAGKYFRKRNIEDIVEKKTKRETVVDQHFFFCCCFLMMVLTLYLTINFRLF